MAGEGKFRATNLMLNVVGKELIVGCGQRTAMTDEAGVRCAQNTASGFAVPINRSNQQILINELQAALKDVKDFKPD